MNKPKSTQQHAPNLLYDATFSFDFIQYHDTHLVREKKILHTFNLQKVNEFTQSWPQSSLDNCYCLRLGLSVCRIKTEMGKMLDSGIHIYDH